MDHPRQLSIPPAAAQDQKAVEIARIWAAGGKQHVVLAADLWKDPAAWGIMLVDLAKHVANAYEQMNSMKREDALARIRLLFDAEWEKATDVPKGHLMD